MQNTQPTEQEKLMFDQVRKLCIVNGAAIDKIAKECNISQDLVAKFFLEVMKNILDNMER